ncbi:MAG: L,D-transpeptidase family protein [Pseudomonadales bacterium]|jgi:murein L,D-transpeptidase YcbB/YkuD|nr:L,D-transpeptidase family protein [Pseudomonadales bacterium]
MRRPRLRNPLAVLLLILLSAASTARVEEEIAEALRRRIEGDGLDGRIEVRKEPISSTDALVALYGDRVYRPLWLEPERWAQARPELLRAIEAAAREGLQPADYHYAALAALPDAPPSDPVAAAAVELLLSDSFLLLARHWLQGKVDPREIHPTWSAPERSRDFTALLEDAVTEGNVFDTLADLRPDHPDYARLVDALARLRQLRADGGFTLVPEGPTLRPGDEDARVERLRRRLAEAGISVPEAAVAQRYDDALVPAVQAIQRRHGLDADGVVGKGTLAALNTPVQARIDSVLATLERYRWLPEDLGRRHIIVNIAGFFLRMEDAGRDVVEMPVVVGREYRQTPVFSSRMTYVVVNPSWEVPPSIARKDKLPLLKRDPDALARGGYELFDSWGQDARRLDLSAVDWNAVPAGRFPYRLRQRPGPENALGRVKFMFPNEHAVYLHDSPARELFARAQRTFSSGCVRLGDPIALLDAVFAGSDWTPDRLAAVLDAGKERTLPLQDPIEVHLLYWTAWIDAADELQLRADVYGRDAPVVAALRAQHAVLD